MKINSLVLFAAGVLIATPVLADLNTSTGFKNVPYTVNVNVSLAGAKVNTLNYKINLKGETKLVTASAAQSGYSGTSNQESPLKNVNTNIASLSAGVSALPKTSWNIYQKPSNAIWSYSAGQTLIYLQPVDSSNVIKGTYPCKLTQAFMVGKNSLTVDVTYDTGKNVYTCQVRPI